MTQITVDSTTELARYDFAGTALPTEWNILQQGVGMFVSVSSSNLSITSGTTASDQTIVRCTNKFRIKVYTRFIIQLSQRIANQNFYLELVNSAGTSFARYDFSGTSATSVNCVTGNGGVTNTPVTVTCASTASYGTFDIYADTNDVVFSSTPSNSNSIKSGVASFDRLILDPDEDYYLQIRVLNGASAPASSTTINVDAVVLQDLTGVKVDIIRGDGTAAMTNAAPVQVVSSSFNSLTPTSGTITAVSQAVTVTSLSQYDGVLISTSGSTLVGTVVFEVSTDGTNWVSLLMNRASTITQESSRALSGTTSEGWRANIAGWTQVRVRCSAFTSGSATFVITPVAISFDPPASSLVASQSGTWTVQPGNTANSTPWLVTNRANIYYNETTTAQAASATYTGTARDVAIIAGSVNPFAKFNAVAFADQAGTLRIEMSNDNATWRRATADTAVAAGSTVYLTVPVTTRYHRAVYINGATLQGAFMLNTSYTAA